MEYLGVVIEIKDKRAFLMTDSCEIVCIRKQPGMYPGLKVIFESSEKIDTMKTKVKFAAVIGSVAAVFIALLYSNLFYSYQIYAYVDFDMDTNLELMVDKENKVLDVKPHDESSKLLLKDMDLKSKPLDIALVEMIDKLDENGLIDLNFDNKVLITACLQDKAGVKVDKSSFKNLSSSYDKIKDKLSSRNIEPYFMDAKLDDRKLAADNNISMGRYSIMKIGKEQGIDIDVEKLKQSRIDEILEKIDFSEEFKDLSKYTSDVTKVEPTDKKNEEDKGSNNTSDMAVDEVDTDLTVDGISDINNIDTIESGNIKTQKIIAQIQKQVTDDIALETEKAKQESSRIKMDWSISIDEKAKRIKEIEANLNARIDEINRLGEEKAQAEYSRLKKEADDLLLNQK